MGIFWRLVLAHLLADFTFQTDFIAKWKRESVLGGLIHSLIFFVCGALLCSGQISAPWFSLGGYGVSGWAALAVLSFLHFLEDEWRIRIIRKYNSADSFLFFGLDQAVHIGLIYLFTPMHILPVPEKWVFLAILFVLTTHFTVIFVYFIEKTLTGVSRLGDKERFYAMAERLAVCSALLLPGYWALVFAAAWIPRIFVRRLSGEFNAPLMNLIMGNAMALLFGIIGRYVVYG